MSRTQYAELKRSVSESPKNGYFSNSAGNFDFATAVESDVEFFRAPNLMHRLLKRV